MDENPCTGLFFLVDKWVYRNIVKQKKIHFSWGMRSFCERVGNKDLAFLKIMLPIYFIIR